MSLARKWVVALVVTSVAALLLHACVSSGPGTDLDDDGLTDDTEDTSNDFIFNPGETDFSDVDTDHDTLCDGRPGQELPSCTGCDDCNNNGSWEPCLSETDPLNDDTNDNGIPDASDPAPLAGLSIDCSQGDVRLAYGASLPAGKPFPVRQTPTPSPAPFPTSTPGPPPPPPTPTPGGAP
jgi:hypothetical protein